ncbi:MAG: peroxiredoxin [Thermoplasmatota archaeon]
MDLLAVGSPAPDISTVDQTGKPIRLADARGKIVVLYFYPADDTPGCTTEACAFRDDASAFQQADAFIWGVSAQSKESHAKFATKFKLNFPLLDDTTGTITRAYGAMKPSGSAARVTYIIGRDGRITHVFPKVTPATHAKETLDAVRAATVKPL